MIALFKILGKGFGITLIVVSILISITFSYFISLEDYYILFKFTCYEYKTHGRFSVSFFSLNYMLLLFALFSAHAAFGDIIYYAYKKKEDDIDDYSEVENYSKKYPILLLIISIFKFITGIVLAIGSFIFLLDIINEFYFLINKLTYIHPLDKSPRTFGNWSFSVLILIILCLLTSTRLRELKVIRTYMKAKKTLLPETKKPL